MNYASDNFVSFATFIVVIQIKIISGRVMGKGSPQLLFCFLLDLKLKYQLYLNQLHTSEHRHPSIAIHFTLLGY